MNRKLWSNEEKVSIVLEVLRGDESAAMVTIRDYFSVYARPAVCLQ